MLASSKLLPCSLFNFIITSKGLDIWRYADLIVARTTSWGFCHSHLLQSCFHFSAAFSRRVDSVPWLYLSIKQNISGMLRGKICGLISSSGRTEWKMYDSNLNVCCPASMAHFSLSRRLLSSALSELWHNLGHSMPLSQRHCPGSSSEELSDIVRSWEVKLETYHANTVQIPSVYTSEGHSKYLFWRGFCICSQMP